jgi:HEPN superfamily AbiU2-like protein
MLKLTPEIIAEFWQLCNGAYEAWLARRGLIDDNADLEQLARTHCAEFLGHLSVITQRDVLHQIAKLHDPPTMFGQNNLSIAYVVDSGLWDRETRMQLGVLKGKLDAFASLLRGARNKLTAHNDLAAILAGRALGQFPVGADVEYFKNLQELVELVAGAPHPFNNLIRNDALVFVESLMRGAKS